MIVVAIDLGGTIIKIGIVKGGKILSSATLPSNANKGLSYSLKTIEEIVKQLLKEKGINKNAIEGVGIGFPGLVDSIKKQVISTNNKYNDANKIDFIKWAAESFDAPVFIENDARVALLGEWQYGAGKGIDNLVMMTLGTGVGSASIIEGELLIGKHFQAGCLGGHFTINVKGTPCSCGNIGCVEAEASTWRLSEIITSNPTYDQSAIAGKVLDFEHIFKYAQQGDELSIEVRNKCIDVWGAGVVNLIHAYDPEAVIFGGGIMQSADVIVPIIKKKVNKQAWTPSAEVKIIPSQIPTKSALLGAYYLVENGLKSI